MINAISCGNNDQLIKFNRTERDSEKIAANHIGELEYAFVWANLIQFWFSLLFFYCYCRCCCCCCFFSPLKALDSALRERRKEDRERKESGKGPAFDFSGNEKWKRRDLIGPRTAFSGSYSLIFHFLQFRFFSIKYIFYLDPYENYLIERFSFWFFYNAPRLDNFTFT